MSEKLEQLPKKIRALYWSVPTLWPNSTVFIIGGGPSISSLPVDKIRGKAPVIGCNLAFLDFPWIDVIYFGDCKVYYWVCEWEEGTSKLPVTKKMSGKYKKQFDAFKGLKISSCPDTRDDPSLHTLFRIHKGITQDRRSIGWNKNAGLSAINLAYHLGAKRIILVGFDMKMSPDGRMNYHNYHLLPVKHPVEALQMHLRYADIVAKEAKELKLDIVNATPDSALTHWPYQDLEEIIEEIINEL